MRGSVVCFLLCGLVQAEPMELGHYVLGPVTVEADDVEGPDCFAWIGRPFTFRIDYTWNGEDSSNVLVHALVTDHPAVGESWQRLRPDHFAGDGEFLYGFELRGDIGLNLDLDGYGARLVQTDPFCYATANEGLSLDVEHFPVGDSNLDGVFDSRDLVSVFQAGRYLDRSGVSWEEGDWNADREFNSNDFVLAFQEQTYNHAALQVPEPNSLLLSMGMVLWMLSSSVGYNRQKF